MNKTLLVLWHGALHPSYRTPFWILREEHGWNVHLAAARSWRGTLVSKTRLALDQAEPIRVHPLRTLGTFHGAVHVQPGFPFLFHRVKPDLCHIHEEPFSLMGWLAAYWCSRAVPSVPSVVYTYQNIHKSYPPPFRWMERFVYNTVSRVLVSSTECGRVLERKGYNRMWDVVPPAVNLARFKYREPRPSFFFTIGYVGRLADEKGLDTLLWAASELNESVRVHLVGDGPARFRLEKLARELGIYERVAFIGPRPHEELDALYHEFDAAVLPSKTTDGWKEQFGRTLVEAMACGVPVIGSNSGAIPEVIGDAGVVFPEGNAEKLIDKILLLQRDERLRKDLSFRGRIRAERYFSAEAAARKLNQHYTEVLDRARRPERVMHRKP